MSRTITTLGKSERTAMDLCGKVAWIYFNGFMSSQIENETTSSNASSKYCG
jgi:hypothetical protein